MKVTGKKAAWVRKAGPAGALVCTSFGLFGSCLGPAQERVDLDRNVGRARTETLRVEVAHGHAAVRDLASQRIHLWQSAPTIEVHLERLSGAVGGEGGAGQLNGTRGDAAPIDLFVENCMPHAELTVLSGNTQVEALPKELPTECRFRLEVESRELSFRLADPDAGVPAAFHFGVLSDIQEAIDRVEDVYRRINQETHLAFLLGAGDLTERGTEPELRRFQRELKVLKIPYYTTLGNHELGVSPPPYHRYFGRGNFSFEFRGVRFTMLDSGSATLDPEVYDWLDDWLAQGQDQMHVVAMHIPPLDPIGVRNGAFASRNEATKLLSRLASGNVDLTIYGHIHSYYHFQNAGIPAHISGGGGAIPERFDSLGRHFLDVTINEHGVAGARVVRVD